MFNPKWEINPFPLQDMQIPLAMVQNSIAASKANFVVITLELNQFVPTQATQRGQVK